VLKNTLTAYFYTVSETTEGISKSKASFEERLKQNLYEGKPVEQSETDLWLAYINYEKSLESPPYSNVMFVIEKSITYLCTSSD